MSPHLIERVAVLGAGNGGKATAADLALQGKRVRLYETPSFAEANLSGITDLQLHCSGDVQGVAKLEHISSELDLALNVVNNSYETAVDTIFICTVVQAHSVIAKMLVPFLMQWPKDKYPLVVLNPGSTGGSLMMAKIWHEMGLVGI